RRLRCRWGWNRGLRSGITRPFAKVLLGEFLCIRASHIPHQNQRRILRSVVRGVETRNLRWGQAGDALNGSRRRQTVWLVAEDKPRTDALRHNLHVVRLLGDPYETLLAT